MIIRRKPLGNEAIRKPRTLGLSLLREGIARVQALSVQRQSTTDEPIDWGDDVSGDGYVDNGPANEANASLIDQGTYDSAFADAIQQAEQPIPRPASQPRRTARRQTVQRQSQAEPHEPPPQVITPPPPPAYPVRRQALSDGDTMPRDLQAMWELHKRLGHIREKPAVTRKPDGSPIPRKRAQIVEMPSKKSAEPELPRSSSPIGEPIQREVETSGSAPIAAQPVPVDTDPDLPAPIQELQAGEIASAGFDSGFDSEATLTDFRIDAPAEVRRLPMPSAPLRNAPVPPPVNIDQPSVPLGAGREYASPPQFDGGDPDDSDEESHTGSEAIIHRTPDESKSAVRRAAIEAAIARVEQPTAPDPNSLQAAVSDEPGFVDDASGSFPISASITAERTPSTPTLPHHEVQRTANQAQSGREGRQTNPSVTSNMPQPEFSQDADPVRRLAVEEAVARAAQPTPYIETDAPESPDSAPATTGTQPTSRPITAVQREAELSRSMPPSPQDVSENSADRVRRAAIEAAVARAERPTAPPLVETSELDQPDNPAASTAQASIQRQAVPPSARPATAQAPRPDTSPVNADSVRRTATDSPVARVERATLPDVSDTSASPQSSRGTQAYPASGEPGEIESPDAPQSGDVSTVIQRRPVQPPATSDQAQAVRRAAIEAAIARVERSFRPDAPDDKASSASTQSVGQPVRQNAPDEPTVPDTLTPHTASVQRHAAHDEFDASDESQGPESSVSVQRQTAQPSASPNRAETVRRAANATETTAARAEVPTLPNIAEPDIADDPANVESPESDLPSMSEPPTPPVQRQSQLSQAPSAPVESAVDLFQAPTPSSDYAESVRRAAIEAAVARAEQPALPDESGVPDIPDTLATPQPPPRRADRVQRQASPAPTQVSPDLPFTETTTPSKSTRGASVSPTTPPPVPDAPVRRTASSRREANEAAITYPDQPVALPPFETFAATESETSEPTASFPSIKRQTPQPPTSPDRSQALRRAAIEAAVARAEQPVPPDLNEAEQPFSPDEAPSAPPRARQSVSIPGEQSETAQPPTSPDRSQALRRAAIEAAVARAEQPVPPDVDEAEQPFSPDEAPSAPTRSRQSTKTTVAPTASGQAQPSAAHSNVQRHSTASTPVPPTVPDDSSILAQSVRRSAIDAAIARAERPSTAFSSDYPESDLDISDESDVYQVSDIEIAEQPSSSERTGPSKLQRAASANRLPQPEPPPLNWPSVSRQSNRPGRGNRGAESVQRAPVESASIADISQPSAEEAEMLNILGLPSDTPITRNTPSTPSVEHSIPSETIGRIPVTGEFVQRESATNDMTAAPQPVSGSPDQGDGTQNASYGVGDVEQIAQAVYKALRNRLRIERERSHGRVQ